MSPHGAVRYRLEAKFLSTGVRTVRGRAACGPDGTGREGGGVENRIH